MTKQEEFQQQHGAEFAQILQSNAFNAAMINLSISFMEVVRLMSDEDISKNAVVVLSDLRGKMRYQTDLISLGVVSETPPEITEEYVDQVKEHAAEMARINKPKQV